MRYRVVWIKVSRDRRHHGWTASSESFDDKDAAREAMNEPFERGVKKAKLQKLVEKDNPHPGEHPEKWATIDSRKNRNLK